MSLHRIMYSSAAGELSHQDLVDILATSKINNGRDEIGGILLHYPATPSQDGAFLQVLEGERARIEEVYARIAVDPRHSRPFLIDSRTVGTRLFDAWGMGLGNLTHEQVQRVIPAVADARQDAPDISELLSSPAVAEALLELWLDEHDPATEPIGAA